MVIPPMLGAIECVFLTSVSSNAGKFTAALWEYAVSARGVTHLRLEENMLKDLLLSVLRRKVIFFLGG
jgi:hypothetical protein